MDKNSKIYIAGHRGMVGSAIWRNLENKGFNNLIGKTSKELNLIDQKAVADFFEKEKPDYVFLAAAKVGGIVANNTYRAQFIYENLQIQNNIIHQSYLSNVKKLMFLGSSCIYPKHTPQPMKEEYLLTGLLEPTNEPYAIAKIAGIKMCEAYRDQYNCNFISVMPTNLYGLNDNFDLEKSHVLPALIRKMHLGKCLENGDMNAIRKDLNKNPIENITGQNTDSEILSIISKYGIKQSVQNQEQKTVVELWGTGSPKREFLHADDMADACVFLMENYNEKQFVNIGCGEDLSIKDLAQLVKEIIGFEGEILWDVNKPDGTPRKLMDVSHLNKTNWHPNIMLIDGIKNVYSTYA